MRYVTSLVLSYQMITSCCSFLPPFPLLFKNLPVKAGEGRSGVGTLASPMGAGATRQGNRTPGDPRVPTLPPCHPRPYETTRRTRFPARFTKYLPLKASRRFPSEPTDALLLLGGDSTGQAAYVSCWSQFSSSFSLRT